MGQMILSWPPADSQLLLNKVPLRMALESLLRVLWHFWRYVEYFSEFREAIGMHLEAFWRLLEGFFEVFKKSVANLEIFGNFCLTPWRGFSPAKNPFVLPKTVWNCSEVFFQVKTNQKHICNVFVRPKLSLVGKLENSKFYPLPNLQIYLSHSRRDSTC